MKLCCVNYEKVFTQYEKDLIETMESFSLGDIGRNALEKEIKNDFMKYRTDLSAFEKKLLEEMPDDVANKTKEQ